MKQAKYEASKLVHDIEEFKGARNGDGLYKTNIFLDDINKYEFDLEPMEADGVQELLEQPDLGRSGFIYHALSDKDEEDLEIDIVYLKKERTPEEFQDRLEKDAKNAVAQWEKYNGEIEILDKLDEIEDIDTGNLQGNTRNSGIDIPTFGVESILNNYVEDLMEKYEEEKQERYDSLEENISHLDEKILEELKRDVDSAYNDIFDEINVKVEWEKTDKSKEEVLEEYDDYSSCPMIVTTDTVGEALKGQVKSDHCLLHLHAPLLYIDSAVDRRHPVNHILIEALKSSGRHELGHLFPNLTHPAERVGPLSLNREARFGNWIAGVENDWSDFNEASLERIDNSELYEDDEIKVDIPDVEEDRADEIFRKNVKAHLEDHYNFNTDRWDIDYNRQNGEVTAETEEQNELIQIYLPIDSETNYFGEPEIELEN